MPAFPAPTSLLLTGALCALALGCNAGAANEVDRGCYTPLVLTFDRHPVSYVQDRGEPPFDLGQGNALTTDWPRAQTPWLARDRDGDGVITGGAELFGSMTALRDGTRAHDGFEALRELDLDGDGRLDATEIASGNLLIWRDADASRTTDKGELGPASEAGLRWIELSSPNGARMRGTGLPVMVASPPRCDTRGNCEVERSAFGYLDQAGQERRGGVVDVHLHSYAREGLDHGDPGHGESAPGAETSCY